MKYLNTNGKVKVVILIILFLLNILIPMKPQPNFGLAIILIPLIFGVFAIPLVIKVHSVIFGQVIERPLWNDFSFNLKRPFRFFHFLAFALLTIGLSICIGTTIKYQALNQYGFTTFSSGIGILLGIEILLKIIDKDQD